MLEQPALSQDRTSAKENRTHNIAITCFTCEMGSGGITYLSKCRFVYYYYNYYLLLLVDAL